MLKSEVANAWQQVEKVQGQLSQELSLHKAAAGVLPFMHIENWP